MKVVGLHAQLIAEQVKKIMLKKSYDFFDGGKPLNVNIVGIRSNEARAGKFDDCLLLVFRNSNLQWEVRSYQITTDPGAYYLANPMNVEGTAILVPGQYRSYKFGTHKGDPALVQQNGPVKVWRDRNKDVILDWDQATVDTGFFGINIHRADSISSAQGVLEDVGRWSAGCQVFKNIGDIDDFLKVCFSSLKLYGDKFTYTLLTQADFD